MIVSKIEPINNVNISKCNHKWLYGERVSESSPPQQRKICSFCGKVEIETIGSYDSIVTFDDLMDRFKKGGVE